MDESWTARAPLHVWRRHTAAAIIVAITTYIQSKVTMPASSAPGDQGAMMNKMMALYMPLLLGYFALTFASGLSIYFITGNLIGIAQYALLGKVDICIPVHVG